MDEARDDTAPPQIGDVLNSVRLDEIARLAALAASYWHSVELAADRGDVLTVVTSYEQAISTTLEALALTQLTARAADINDVGLIDAARGLLAPSTKKDEEATR